MNKKLEEKLAMLAFGDMSPEETARLEREVAGNREAMMVLDDYRGMRTGLRAMGEIPEHQLSTERLRNAVLNQGLKPKARPQFGWLWMPTMAAVLAFGVFFFRGGHQPSPIPGGATALDITKPAPVAVEKPESIFALATASGQIMSVTSPAPKMTLTSYSTSRHSRRDETSKIEALKARVLADFDSQMMVMSTGAQGTPMARSDAGSNADAPIVLIESTRDAKTGAQKATEVDSASNVVVGG